MGPDGGRNNTVVLRPLFQDGNRWGTLEAIEYSRDETSLYRGC